MKKIKAKIFCNAMYSGTITVPDELTEEEAQEYAQEHIDEFKVNDLEWVEGPEEAFDVTFFEEEDDG